MSSIPHVATTLQTVLGPDLEPIGRRTGLIQRLRKFSAEILLKMLVFTLLKCPSPKTRNYVSSAAQLGLIITERAVKKRFTPQLVTFLRPVLERLMQHMVASTPVDTPLLAKFTSVRIGDSTTVTLPADCAGNSPAAAASRARHSGPEDSGPLGLDHGTTAEGAPRTRPPQRRQERRRRGDAACQVAVAVGPGILLPETVPPVDRRRCLLDLALATGHGGPHPGGDAVGPVATLATTHVDGPLDIAVLLGSTARVACRLIAPYVPPEVAARRRQKAYEKAQKSGRTPTREHLQWCDWTILVTNCSPELLTWKEVVVLYRTRWQIELLFKLWKSHNRLATHAESQSVAWQMAEFWAKLIGVILQHWLLLTMTWLDSRRAC